MAFPHSDRPSAGRRGVPTSVRVASGLMVAGGVTQLLRGAVILGRYAAAKAGDDPNVTQAVVVLGLLETVGFTALWFWMAAKCRAGRDWARLTATAFFVLELLGLFVPLHSGYATSTLVHVLGFVTFGIGLAAVILLWTGESSRYF